VVEAEPSEPPPPPPPLLPPDGDEEPPELPELGGGGVDPGKPLGIELELVVRQPLVASVTPATSTTLAHLSVLRIPGGPLATSGRSARTVLLAWMPGTAGSSTSA
jgi:hypothetical protein